MKKIDWSRPITLKDHMKGMVIGSMIAFMAAAVYLLFWYWVEFKEWCGMTIKKIKTKFHR